MSAIKALGHSLLTQIKNEGRIRSVKKEEFLKEKGDYLGYSVDESPVLAIFLFENGVETFSFSGGWNHYLVAPQFDELFSQRTTV
jgi:hypothetical protein